MATFVAFFVHAKSFNILHHALRIMDEIEASPFLGAGSLLICLTKEAQQNQNRNRSTWARQWVKNRPKHGAYNGIARKLRGTDPFSFKNFLRLDNESSSALFKQVSPLIQKQDKNMRKAIPPGQRFALTQHFLIYDTLIAPNYNKRLVNLIIVIELKIFFMFTKH